MLNRLEKLTAGTPRKGHTQLVCNSDWQLPGKPRLVWHNACLITEGACVDLSMDIMHLKDPLVLFGCEGSALKVLSHLRLLR